MYGQCFIGCSEYPRCKFTATRDDRDRIAKDMNDLKDMILQKAETKMTEVNKLLALARKIKERACTYEEIREIKREWFNYGNR
jgi:ssDNA-binding Zn-finger/Zn-ribbon topoisomerase 1